MLFLLLFICDRRKRRRLMFWRGGLMLRGSGRKRAATNAPREWTEEGARVLFFWGQGGFYLFVWLMLQGGGGRKRALVWTGNRGRGGFYPADNGVI